MHPWIAQGNNSNLLIQGYKTRVIHKSTHFAIMKSCCIELGLYNCILYVTCYLFILFQKRISYKRQIRIHTYNAVLKTHGAQCMVIEEQSQGVAFIGVSTGVIIEFERLSMRYQVLVSKIPYKISVDRYFNLTGSLLLRWEFNHAPRHNKTVEILNREFQLIYYTAKKDTLI